MAAVPTKFVRVRATGHECNINASDFDPQIHVEASTPRDIDETPGSIATVNVEDALELIAKAETLSALDALQAAEEASIKNKNGRKAVLRAIKERRAELRED